MRRTLFWATLPLATSVCIAACGSSSSAPGAAGGGTDGGGADGAPGPGVDVDGSSAGEGDGASPADAPTETPCGTPGTLDTAFAKGGLLVAETPKALTSESIAAASDGADGVYDDGGDSFYGVYLARFCVE